MACAVLDATFVMVRRPRSTGCPRSTRSSRATVWNFAASIATLAVILVAPCRTYAQTTTTSGPTVTGTSQVNPTRTINGATAQARPQNLTPTGVSYSDCINDLTLTFSVYASNFSNQNLEVWATKTATCTDDTARGVGAVATCWRVSQDPLVAGTTTTGMSVQAVVRVRDLLGPQRDPNSAKSYSTHGSEACSTQDGDGAVPMVIWFLPVTTGGAATGTSYKYAINTDLVGPPAPTGVSSSVGDTLFNVNWTPTTGTEVAGYDVFMDPLRGGGTSDAASDSPTYELVCPDAATSDAASDSASQVADASTDSSTDDASTDSSTDASTGTAAPSGCVYTAVSNASANTTSNAQCTVSAALSTGTANSTSCTETTDDAGNDAGATCSSSGGNSTISLDYLVDNNAGFTVADKTSGSYTIKGLTNDVYYKVVVAAVDTSGNVGLASGQVCDYPAAVIDFWQQYRNAGGKAGGGFCALTNPGRPIGSTLGLAGVGIGIAAIGRRRWRRRR